MEIVDVIGLLAPITYFVMLIAERRWPARAFPERRGWQWIGIAFLVLIGSVSTVIVSSFVVFGAPARRALALATGSMYVARRTPPPASALARRN